MRYSYEAVQDRSVVLQIEEDDTPASSVASDRDLEVEKQADVYDMQFLHRVIEDAGRWAFGIIMVELWVLDDSGTRLFRPDCGWWMDQYADKDDTFSRLTDKSLPSYIPADPVMPGVGLAGYLWSKATGRSGGASRQSLAGIQSMFGGEKLTWCEVKPLANDPLQPYDERTQYLAKAGLGLAAGVPFNMGGTRGIVLYMARDTASLSDLTDKTNEEYLQRSTTAIASSYALRRARIEMVRKRKKAINACWRRMHIKLLAIRAMGLNLADIVHREEKKKEEQRPKSIHDIIRRADGSFNKVKEYFKGKLNQEVRKFNGDNVQLAPAFSWYQSFFTFMGCFLTLAMLSNVSNFMMGIFGPDHSILLPPFGAMVALHYGLTSAPASQPLQAVVGQTIGVTIAHLTGTYLDADLWLKQSLGTALAIAIMVKLGVLHPPAGAAAIVFSSGKMSWIQGAMILFGDVLAIFASTFINNWDEKRQYPTSWGLRPILDCVSLIYVKEKKLKAKKETRTKADNFPKNFSSHTIFTETTVLLESQSTIDFIE